MIMLRLSFAVASLFALTLAASDDLAVDGSAESSGVVFPEMWATDLFYRALADFAVRDVGTEACRKQTELYEKHLRNHSYWAVRMFESWNRYPNGILAGNNYNLGVYDECVDVHYPIQGQYCLSEVKLMPPDGKDYSYKRKIDQTHFNHSWHTILGWVDYSDQIRRNYLNLGICIPKSCSALDLQTTLQKEFDRVLNPKHVKTVVKVDPILCTVNGDMYPYDTSFYITSSLLLLLILICWIVTFRHYARLSSRQRKKEKRSDHLYEIFNSFSFIENGKDLLKFDKDNELNPVNGFKTVIMLFVLFGHRFLYFAGNPLTYTESFEKIYSYGPDILLTSMNLVDPFFFISGLLMYITILPTFKNPGPFWIKCLLAVLYRIARLLPAYCVIMAIMAHIIPHLGDGPLWPQKVWSEAETCKTYWWTNILFISNFIDVKNQCLLVSWYISCDIQFFIVGIIIMSVYIKNKKFGVLFITVLLGISLSVPFVFTFLTKGDGILKVHVPFLENPRSSVTFDKSYRPSYMRATPFFAGLATGFAIEKLKEIKFKFSPTVIYSGTFLITVFSIWSQFYGVIFYKRHRPYYPLEQALYSSYSHCSWTLMSVWISVCHFTSGYGLLSKVLINRLFIPLGRLSYSVFLVNIITMLVSQSTQRLPVYPSPKTLIDAWICDTFKSYLMAALLYFIVEAPFGNLIRIMFGRGKKKFPLHNDDVPIENNICTETSKNEITRI